MGDNYMEECKIICGIWKDSDNETKELLEEILLEAFSVG